MFKEIGGHGIDEAPLDVVETKRPLIERGVGSVEDRVETAISRDCVIERMTVLEFAVA